MHSVLVPRLGEAVEGGKVICWLKLVGEPVEMDSSLLTFETDKINVEIPAPVAGVVRAIFVAPGENVPVGAVLALIGERDEPLPDPDALPGQPLEGVQRCVDREKDEKPFSLMTIITTILLIFLLLPGSVALFFRQQATSTTHSLPTTIHWQEVWHQDFATSLVAAPSDPTMLYACAFLPSFLHSTDSGAHWQQLQASRGHSGDCSITVNPSQAKDLYASSFASLDSATLEHSSDGGQTWTTIRATLTMPDGQHVPWAGGRLSFVGNHLFAVQDVQNTWHVISSTDGGHTWTVIDAEIISPHQGIHSYAVDPVDPNIIYELVGAIIIGHFSYAPSGATPTPEPSPIPPNQLILHLYKTTDGGRSWRALLSSVPYGSSLQLASANPDLLYIGGLTGSSDPSSSHTFHLQRSANGGLSWQPIAVPVNVPLSNNWFVGASGLLYDTSSSPDSSHPSNTKTFVGSIQRYNPSAHQWSTLAQPSSAGAGGLLTVTSAASHGGDVLWFTNLDNALYRGTL